MTRRNPLMCQYCGSSAILRDSSVIYGRSYGPIWMCKNYPQCDAYCGVHPGTKTPLGILANKELRDAKKRAHTRLDPLWKSGRMKRGQVYKRVAALLGRDEIHIGESDIVTCELIEKACEIVWKEVLR